MVCGNTRTTRHVQQLLRSGWTCRVVRYLHLQGGIVGNMRSEGGGSFKIFLLVYETTQSHIPKYTLLQSDTLPPEIKYLLYYPWCSIAYTVMLFFLTSMPLYYLCGTYTSLVTFLLEKTRNVSSTHRYIDACSKNQVLYLRAEIKIKSPLKFSPDSNKHK